VLIYRLFKWKRVAVSKLSLRYPSLLRFLPTPRPLNVHRFPYRGRFGSRDLLVCLPGIGDDATDFDDWGFVDLVRAHPWAADVILVDAHYGYYADRTILEQLHDDVLFPASSLGYRSVWLAGISLGGLGALLYASRYQQDIKGVVAIAPFLGARTLVQEITVAGGLAQWTSTIPSADAIQAFWTWAHARARSPFTPEIYLAFGREDPFVEAHQLFASTLPPAHVLTAPGGHRWKVWQALWMAFLRHHIPRDVPEP